MRGAALGEMIFTLIIGAVVDRFSYPIVTSLLGRLK
jgi:hypothetical protein